MTPSQIESLFYQHLENAIEADFELPPGFVSNKEGSRSFGGGRSIVVYSGDHDTHFHIQHKGRGIDARFSFPEMTLIDYKSSKDTFSSRELKNITTTCSIPMYRKFIENELGKRRTS